MGQSEDAKHGGSKPIVADTFSPDELIVSPQKQTKRAEADAATLAGLLSDFAVIDSGTLSLTPPDGGTVDGLDKNNAVPTHPAVARQTSDILAQYRRAEERYEFLGTLGTGGMGVVRRVRDRLLNRTLAMKTLHRRLLRDEGHVLRFIHEAQVVSQLQHPNILAIHDLGVWPTGDVFFTMAEIEGHSLSHFIEHVHTSVRDDANPDGESGWNLHRLILAVHDVCKAVAYAHGKGVLHRDLKPDNVMVGPFGEVLVVDWGISQVLHGPNASVQTMEGSEGTNESLKRGLYGTPAYMAPELARKDRAHPTRQSDIYALGVILYEVLKGHNPFKGNGRDAVLLKASAGEFEPFHYLPRGDAEENTAYGDVDRPVAYVSDQGTPLPGFLVEICQKAMSLQPEDRFQSVKELIDIIGGWLDGSRRRDTAMLLVQSARGYNRQIRSAEQGAARLRIDAKQMSLTLSPWEPEDKKHRLWEMEDRATTLTTMATLMRVQQIQGFREALAHKADLIEAHSSLGTYFQSAHRKAEYEGDVLEARRAEVVLREHAEALPMTHPLRQELALYLEGNGSITLQSSPPGAVLTLAKFRTKKRRLVLGPEQPMGSAPLHQHPLPMGSYRLNLTLDGYHPVTYPLYNPRCSEHTGTTPDGELAPIETLPLGTLGAEDCYVPAGWCWLGGDSQTPNSLPKMKAWIHGFVMRRHPVTHGEWVVFLNELVTKGQRDEALLHLPRQQSASDAALGKMVYTLNADGTFVLPTDDEHAFYLPRQPVTMIPWRSARAYAAWYAQRTGTPWRLPLEFEWEKAARGVDGRFYPWGNIHDPSWSCMKDSHSDTVLIREVDDFPDDESLYGVRGTAGNTRDWCLDRFRDEGPQLKNGRLSMPTPDDMADTGFKSSRGGSYGNSASRARSADRDWWFPERSYLGRGLRLVWGLDDRK